MIKSEEIPLYCWTHDCIYEYWERDPWFEFKKHYTPKERCVLGITEGVIKSLVTALRFGIYVIGAPVGTQKDINF